MNADPIAAVYRWIEYLAFGRALERCRLMQLGHLASARRILILGEGDGRFLARLLPLASNATEIDIIDSSSNMLELARNRVRNLPASPAGSPVIRFRHLDATVCRLPPGPYDAVVTHFFLDCLNDAQASAIVEQVSAALPQGLWVISEFQQPLEPLARFHAFLWIRAMYAFFRVTTGLRPTSVPAYRAMLEAAGFELQNQQEQRFGLIVSQLWRKRTGDLEGAAAQR